VHAQIAENVLSDPSNPKLRKIKVKNATLAEAVLAVRGGSAFLKAMGFHLHVIEFEEYFHLQRPAGGGGGGGQLSRLELALRLLAEAREGAEAEVESRRWHMEQRESSGGSDPALPSLRGRQATDYALHAD
jgi:hypothetical protein